MNFSEGYRAIREKEGRNYPDDLLKRLPMYPEDEPLSKEWAIRGRTLLKVMNHLNESFSEPRILDLGCGNGWMSRHMVNLPGAEVLGVDVVSEELEQAKRVFGHFEGLSFAEADVMEEDWPYGEFDVVTMGASVQYFPSLTALVKRLRQLLTPEGEIHIFDSPFYKPKDVAMAQARSIAYYASMGYPQLSEHYHHHTVPEMKALGGEWMYNPRSFRNEIRRKLMKSDDSPFPWWKLGK